MAIMMKRTLQTGPNTQLGGVKAVLLIVGYQVVTVEAVTIPPRILAAKTDSPLVSSLGQSILFIANY